MLEKNTVSPETVVLKRTQRIIDSSREKLFLKVLIATYDQPQLEQYKKVFESMGFEVVVVQSGEELFATLSKEANFDFILIDNDFENKEKSEIMSIILRIHDVSPTGEHIPVIFYTNDVFEDWVNRYLFGLDIRCVQKKEDGRVDFAFLDLTIFNCLNDKTKNSFSS